MVKIMTHIEATIFETLKLINLLKKAATTEVTEICNLPKSHLAQSKSQYEQAKCFTAKYSANFIVMMNLTF